MAAPMLSENRLKFLGYAVFLCQFWEYLTAEDAFKEFLLCRHCGHEIAQPTELIRIPSVHSKGQRNETILGVKGVLIQLFENPLGTKFEVIAARNADVHTLDQLVSADTWFPGFSWRIILCPRCGFHIGWSFERNSPTDTEEQHNTFFGLIMGNMIQNDYADSLLITPKAYRS